MKFFDKITETNRQTASQYTRYFCNLKAYTIIPAMEESKMKVIECDGLQVAVTVEADLGDEHPIYYPANCLVYIEQGQLNLKIEGRLHSLQEGEFCLIRKYTYGKFFKTWNENANCFRDHVFVLHDVFIKDVIRNFELPEDFMPCTESVISLPSSPILLGLMHSIKTYVTGQAQIDRSMIRIKTAEAILAMTQSRPDLLHIFNEFSEPSRADLVNFVEHNYTRKLTLDQFAEMSGRSLSSFNREFRREYNMPPHKWIKQKRLELAKKLLAQTPKAVSDVYLEVGFEDLAHFSRSFKNYFGQNPSDFKSIASA